MSHSWSAGFRPDRNHDWHLDYDASGSSSVGFSPAMRVEFGTGRMGLGTDHTNYPSLTARATFANTTSDGSNAIPTLALRQSESSSHLISFIASSQADDSSPISSEASLGDQLGQFRVEVNGVVGWVPIYEHPAAG